MKTKVFVVDDHPLLRLGLAVLVNNEDDMEICGEADNAQAATELIESTRPDVALLDISLKGTNGIDLLIYLKACFPDLKVLILSLHDESVLAQRAFTAGASGYLVKDEATDNALTAIRHVRTGKTYLSNEIATRLGHGRWENFSLHSGEWSPAGSDSSRLNGATEVQFDTNVFSTPR